MSLFNALKKRLTNQFLAVIIYEDRCKIKQKVVKNSKLIHKEEFNFDIESKEKLGPKVINFINDLQEEYENSYIALFLNTSGQGVLPNCQSDVLDRFHIDKSGVKTICKDNRFLMYATIIDIKWAEKLFKRTGLDFIFSPFLVLDYFIKQAMKREDFNKDQVILYILNTKNALTLMVQKDRELLYGTFFNIAKDDDLLYTNYSEEFSNEDEISELDLDEMSELEIEDLSEATNNSNFAKNLASFTDELSENDERIIRYLNAALKEFYTNDLYNSEFITATKIYDDVGLNEGVLKYIENELLLDTSAENISVSDVILTLAQEEALLNV